MDIRTKLIFALVGTALLSMLAIVAVGYSEARALLRQTSVRQLDALAESRKRDLDAVIDGWGERVGLLGSRTQLRRSLSGYSASGGATDLALIERILRDARNSAPSIVSLAIYGTDRRRVAMSFGPRGEPPAETLPDSIAEAVTQGPPRFLGVDMGDAGHVSTVRYVTPLELAGQGLVGWLTARLAADDLTDLAADTTGLGASGETLVVTRREGTLHILHPTRHEPASADASRPDNAVDPAQLAASGESRTFFENAYDYRNRRVWAATRHLPALGWGIVVKVDAEEERGPVLALRNRMARLAVSLAAFAILAGVLLGLHLARPIHDLAEVANRIRAGETHVRATVHHQDEVGMLARTFNRMADTLTRGHLTLADDEEEEQEDGAA